MSQNPFGPGRVCLLEVVYTPFCPHLWPEDFILLMFLIFAQCSQTHPPLDYWTAARASPPQVEFLHVPSHDLVAKPRWIPPPRLAWCRPLPAGRHAAAVVRCIPLRVVQLRMKRPCLDVCEGRLQPNLPRWICARHFWSPALFPLHTVGELQWW